MALFDECDKIQWQYVGRIDALSHECRILLNFLELCRMSRSIRGGGGLLDKVINREYFC